MTLVTRAEQLIFSDLSAVCQRDGFIHAIAAFCFRDNVWGFGKELTAEDVVKRRGTELIRTEISTLIGLMTKAPINFAFPGAAAIQEMMDGAEQLLEELHHSMVQPAMEAMAKAVRLKDMEANPFGTAAAMREPVFYGGESAFDFQYLDLAERKYAGDDDWLEKNKGFSIKDATLFASYIQTSMPMRLMAALKNLRKLHPEEWTMLPGFTFSLDEVAQDTGLSRDKLDLVIDAFTDRSSPPNATFETLSDFNTAHSHPIIRIDRDHFVLLQSYSLLEALYESPFYWMISDRDYRARAAEARGRFTERYTAERLRSVFGEAAVFDNVLILDKKKATLGEIDVLVLFGTRAVIVQTKSKKLTIAARKGNDAAMKADFAGAVQDAYDQAKSCSELLLAGHTLIDGDARPVAVPPDLEVMIPVCVVADHYPALSFQTRQFLAHKEAGRLIAPFVVDTFTIDVLCELLDSPLHLLSYLERRALYNDKVLAGHELAVLGYHLKSNLWVDEKFDMISMTEDLAADVDVAMMVRRTGVPGKRVPPGVLTAFRRGHIGKILVDLERSPHPAEFDLGMMLLTLSEETISHLNKGIDLVARKARGDGKVHDFTMSIAGGSTGITIHSSAEPIETAGPALAEHCDRRKYVARAESWFGLLVNPKSLVPRTGLELKGAWSQSNEMDLQTRDMRPDPQDQREPIPEGTSFESLIRPLGRNDRCWCGSGLKYKKCHLDSDERARARRR